MFFFQRDLFVQVIQIAVDPHTGVAAPPGGIQLLLLRALALAYHRSQHLEFGAVLQLEHGIHHLIHGLLADDAAAHRAVGHAHPGIQQAQVIIDLRHGAHGGAGLWLVVFWSMEMAGDRPVISSTSGLSIRPRNIRA